MKSAFKIRTTIQPNLVELWVTILAGPGRSMDSACALLADVVQVSSHTSAFKIRSILAGPGRFDLHATCLPPACRCPRSATHSAPHLHACPACMPTACRPPQLHPLRRRWPQRAPPACRLHADCMPTACRAPQLHPLRRHWPQHRLHADCMPTAPPAPVLATARPTCMLPACRLRADCMPTARSCTPCAGVGHSTACMPTACRLHAAAPPAPVLATARPTCIPPACPACMPTARSCTPCAGVGHSTACMPTARRLHADCTPTARRLHADCTPTARSCTRCAGVGHSTSPYLARTPNS